MLIWRRRQRKVAFNRTKERVRGEVRGRGGEEWRGGRRIERGELTSLSSIYIGSLE